VSKLNASAFVPRIQARVGEGYVYGATGVTCTLSLLKSKQAQYGAKMGNGYYQLNGDYTKGKCARWMGKRVQDCSNFIQSVRRELGDSVASASANMLWGQCKVRGKLATMPKQPGVLVFSVNGEGNMHHVGVYVGGGKVVESANVVAGVIVSGLPGGWENWGYADFIEYDLAYDVTPETPQEPPTPHPETEDAIYTVVRGDTLSGIGKRYGVAWKDIAKANNVPGPQYVIFAGQKLTIPGASAIKEPNPQPIRHTVVKGENLSRIAKIYGKRWQDIADDNGVKGPLYIIHTGQVLIIY
jgi:LysM repeat protein